MTGRVMFRRRKSGRLPTRADLRETAESIHRGPSATEGTGSREESMAAKLGIGDAFPSMTLKLVGGGTLDLPQGLDARYKVILFYRGHW